MPDDDTPGSGTPDTGASDFPRRSLADRLAALEAALELPDPAVPASRRTEFPTLEVEEAEPSWSPRPEPVEPPAPRRARPRPAADATPEPVRRATGGAAEEVPGARLIAPPSRPAQPEKPAAPRARRARAAEPQSPVAPEVVEAPPGAEVPPPPTAKAPAKKAAAKKPAPDSVPTKKAAPTKAAAKAVAAKKLPPSSTVQSASPAAAQEAAVPAAKAPVRKATKKAVAKAPLAATEAAVRAARARQAAADERAAREAVTVTTTPEVMEPPRPEEPLIMADTWVAEREKRSREGSTFRALVVASVLLLAAAAGLVAASLVLAGTKTYTSTALVQLTRTGQPAGVAASRYANEVADLVDDVTAASGVPAKDVKGLGGRKKGEGGVEVIGRATHKSEAQRLASVGAEKLTAKVAAEDNPLALPSDKLSATVPGNATKAERTSPSNASAAAAAAIAAGLVILLSALVSTRLSNRVP